MASSVRFGRHPVGRLARRDAGAAADAQRAVVEEAEASGIFGWPRAATAWWRARRPHPHTAIGQQLRRSARHGLPCSCRCGAGVSRAAAHLLKQHGAGADRQAAETPRTQPYRRSDRRPRVRALRERGRRRHRQQWPARGSAWRSRRPARCSRCTGGRSRPATCRCRRRRSRSSGSWRRSRAPCSRACTGTSPGGGPRRRTRARSGRRRSARAARSSRGSGGRRRTSGGPCLSSSGSLPKVR